VELNPYKAFIRNRWREYALCLVVKRRRLRLSVLGLNAWLPTADETPVSIFALPKGEWGSPMVDIVYLLKLVRLLEPRRILQLGSYRGYVARAIAEHMPQDARLVTVDIYPDHGEAYRGTDLADRIDRRVGAIGPAMFPDEERGGYDLIVLDADHSRNPLTHDTELALSLLRPSGVMVWQDYTNFGAFDGRNAIPEYLAELAQVRPVAHLAGSNLAVHCQAWAYEGRAAFEEMLALTRRWEEEEHWTRPLPPVAVRTG
jgi:predicted O-methyltransferase YrrM